MLQALQEQQDSLTVAPWTMMYNYASCGELEYRIETQDGSPVPTENFIVKFENGVITLYPRAGVDPIGD